MAAKSGSEIIQDWPEASREAARLVLDAYGEPDEAGATHLVWHQPGPWKRVVATKEYHQHDFPAPHTDSVQSVVSYAVPPEKVDMLALFDGSVVVDRTRGEVSARCHDEQANCLALNLMHDIVTGEKNVDQARAYYATEFLDHRRGKPTPYMEGLRFTPDADAADADVRLLTDDDLERAQEEGRSGA